MDTHTQYLYCAAMNEQELKELELLKAEGMQKGIRYKIDPGTASGILCQRDGHLAGFMTADCFGGPAVESAAIAKSREDWDNMLEVLVKFAKSKLANELLFITSPNDALVTRILTSRSLASTFSEYRMVFDENAFVPAPIQGVALRQAGDRDSGYIDSLDKEAFGGGTGHMTDRDIANTRIILKDGEPAGKLRIDEADGVTGIYGVVIGKELRGRGIGTQALTIVLANLIRAGASQVYLEVDSENPAAFHLYEKMGFRVKSEFCYYPEKR